MRNEDIYSNESMEMLESIADKHGLLLSTELINFADDVWAMATQAERQAHALATVCYENELGVHMRSCHAMKTKNESDCNCYDWGASK